MYLVEKNLNGNKEFEFISSFKEAMTLYEEWCEEAYEDCYAATDMDNSVKIHAIDDAWLHDQLTDEDDFLIMVYKMIGTEEGYEWEEYDIVIPKSKTI